LSTQLSLVEPVYTINNSTLNIINSLVSFDYNLYLDQKTNYSTLNNLSTQLTSSEFDYLDIEIRRRQKRYPHLTLDEVYNRMMSLGSDGMEMSLRMSDDYDNVQIDYSNLFTHNGEVVDVTKISPAELVNLSSVVEDIDKFESLEHVRSVYALTSPNVKLYYPEPFIASPSFMHNDLGFVHILQYQFWL